MTTVPSVSIPMCCIFSPPNIPGRIRSTSRVFMLMSWAKSSERISPFPCTSNQSPVNQRSFSSSPRPGRGAMRHRPVSMSSSSRH
ncbi:Flagellin N-methylase, partial [Dysosmobacter welbionis]